MRLNVFFSVYWRQLLRQHEATVVLAPSYLQNVMLRSDKGFFSVLGDNTLVSVTLLITVSGLKNEQQTDNQPAASGRENSAVLSTKQWMGAWINYTGVKKNSNVIWSSTFPHKSPAIFSPSCSCLHQWILLSNEKIGPLLLGNVAIDYFNDHKSSRDQCPCAAVIYIIVRINNEDCEKNVWSPQWFFPLV